jgi:hypothetical protein
MADAFVKSKGKGAYRFDNYGRKIIYNGVLCRQATFPYDVIIPDKYLGFLDWEPEIEINKNFGRVTQVSLLLTYALAGIVNTCPVQ